MIKLKIKGFISVFLIFSIFVSSLLFSGFTFENSDGTGNHDDDIAVNSAISPYATSSSDDGAYSKNEFFHDGLSFLFTDLHIGQTLVFDTYKAYYDYDVGGVTVTKPIALDVLGVVVDVQYSYLPVDIYVRYSLPSSGTHIVEHYGNYEVLFGIYNIFILDESFYKDPIWEGEYPNIWNKEIFNFAVENGLIRRDDVTIYEYYYTELDLTALFGTGFCHSDFSTSWSDYRFIGKARNGIERASIDSNNIFEFMTVVEEVPELIFEVDGTSDTVQVDHSQHSHYSPYSSLSNVVPSSLITEYESKDIDTLYDKLCYLSDNELIYSNHSCTSICAECGGCRDTDCFHTLCLTKCRCLGDDIGDNGDDTDDPPDPNHKCESVCAECGFCKNSACEGLNCVLKCNCNAEVVYPYPCTECGHMVESLDDLLNHECKPGGNPTDGPDDDPNNDSNDDPDDKDKDKDNNNDGDNNGDGDKNGDNNNPGDKDGNGEQIGWGDPVPVLGKKFTFGFPSISNLKNLFDKEFWEAVVKGEVEFDPLGTVVSGISIIALLALLPVLCIIFPPVWTVVKTILKGLWIFIKYLFIGLWWIICLPFRGIAALIRKRKERAEQSEREERDEKPTKQLSAPRRSSKPGTRKNGGRNGNKKR